MRGGVESQKIEGGGTVCPIFIFIQRGLCAFVWEVYKLYYIIYRSIYIYIYIYIYMYSICIYIIYIIVCVYVCSKYCIVFYCVECNSGRLLWIIWSCIAWILFPVYESIRLNLLYDVLAIIFYHMICKYVFLSYIIV